MSDPLRATASSRPDAPALDDGARVWTYAQLDAAVARMARRLRLVPFGVRSGATVALVAHQSALAVQALFAVPRTGATLAILHPRLGRAPLERALDVVGPDLLLSTDADVRGLALDPGWVTTLDDLPKPPPDDASALSQEARSSHDADSSGNADASRDADVSRPFALLWTSGTSGSPGSVPVASDALNASARAVAVRLDLRPDDRWYASLSPAHIGGLAMVHRVVHTGSCLLVRGPYSAETLADLIDREDVSHASLVPTMLQQLLDVRVDRPVPSTVRCLLIGGAAANGRLVERAVAVGYPIALTYGLTEACSQVATAPPDLVEEKPGTVGFPLDGVELRIREGGEIWVRGPTVVPSLADEDGWLATGDLGTLDDEGHLWVVGRIDERIVSGGVNVDPRSVEDVIRDLPGVAAVAVVGLPDDTWGEVVGALVVPESPLDLPTLESAVRESLPSAEVPRRLAIVDELPRNANGKIDRAEVRARLIGRDPA